MELVLRGHGALPETAGMGAEETGAGSCARRRLEIARRAGFYRHLWAHRGSGVGVSRPGLVPGPGNSPASPRGRAEGLSEGRSPALQPSSALRARQKFVGLGGKQEDGNTKTLPPRAVTAEPHWLLRDL